MRNVRTLWSAPLAVAIMCHAPLATADAGEVHYHENFRNYRDTVPAVAADVGFRLGNDPIWTRSADANFSMPRSGLVFDRFFPDFDHAHDVTAYDVLFDFRFRTDKEPRLALHLRHARAGDDRHADLIVAFHNDRVALHSDQVQPALQADATLDWTIPDNQWQTAAVKVADGRLRVHVTKNRVFRQVLDVAIPALPARGINFHGFEGSAFSITNITVRDPAPLPDNGITRLLPDLDAILPGRDAYTSGGQQPEVSVPADDVFGLTFRTGSEADAVRMRVNRGGGEGETLTFDATSVDSRHVERELPDGIIRVRGLGTVRGADRYHIRPMLRRYHTSYSFTDTFHDIVRDWDLLPRASGYPVTLEARRTRGGVDLYLNGRFAAQLEGDDIEGLTFSFAPSASHKRVMSRSADHDASRYLPLDVAALRRARGMVNAAPSIATGGQAVEHVPMRVTDGRGSADVGLTRAGQGNWALEVDEYTARSPFDGLLTEVHFSVPSAPYRRAWVLAAVEPDPAKDPILTTRITQYRQHGVGLNTLADTVLTLPRDGEPIDKHITRVGSVTGSDAEGNAIDLPLYLVEVALDTGSIIDIVNDADALNLDFFGKPGENFQQLDYNSQPDPDSTSAVHIFGVTLEKSPVTLDFEQSQPGNVFHNDEQRQTGVIVRALEPAQGKIAWVVNNVDGQPVAGGGSTPFDLEPGEEQRYSIPLDMEKLGWYELLISVEDDAGETLLTHPARFALLGEDRRQAGYDSPYGVWWFDGAHNTPSDLDFAGPIMHKAGIRLVAWTGQSEEAMSEWTITKDQVNMPFRWADLNDPEAAKERAKGIMDGHLEKYPHLREVLIFHESGPGNDVPLELVGVEPELSDAQLAREQRYADLYNLAGAFFREHYPELKTVIGNNSSSQAVVAAILRHGGDVAYMDYIGQESPSQVFTPEKLQEWAIQGHHIASDTAEALSGVRVPATGSYEFTYRSERDMGEHQQAQWYARDMLISHANGFTRIGPGILFDVQNAYYNGLWGSSGLLQRGPFGYPKKAYVAYATLTNVLDRVTLRGEIDTGSPTVYAVEFERADGKYVTALWAARGEASYVMRYQAPTDVEVVDMYGRRYRPMRTSERDHAVGVSGGTSPRYVIADEPISEIVLASHRTFSADEARADRATVAAPLDDVSAVTIDEDDSLDTPLVSPLQLPVRRLGRFAVRQVSDEEMGEVIELELDTSHNADLTRYFTEYTVLRLNEPATVEGEPAALGVWVKGNSNWGRVTFEFEDAGGEVWRGVGTSGWGCDILDWPGNLSVNFDGWNFISTALRETTLFNDHSPGPVLEQWVSSGGNKRIEYPIKVTALIVEMNREPLGLTGFTSVDPVIRLHGVSGLAE